MNRREFILASAAATGLTACTGLSAKRGGEGLSRLLAHGDDRNDEGYLCHYLVRYGGEEYVMAVSLSATDSIEVLTPHRDIEILEIQESVKK